MGMNGFNLVLFAMTAGFTVSGIAANLYRLIAPKPRGSSFDTTRMMVMIVAGPSVLFEAAMRGLLSKQWGLVAFGLAASTVLYWSFAIGLLTVNIALYLRSPV
jgi:hypothetical protein